ncbi:MAG: DinB family protein [Actinomycetes bacterium]|jgi:uncharacterized damage-inducible protein DinB
MSETTHRLFRHMAWANQRVYEAVQKLPDEALGAYIVNPEWTAGQILQHIVGGADWYVHCLTQAPWRDIYVPKSMKDLDLLKEQLSEFDAKIATQADLPDIYLTLKEGEKSWQNLRSTILAEAIYHAAEHRTQLIDALESKGYTPIALDDLDLWKFEQYEKEMKTS